jgi:serine/threonine protein kinase
VTPDPAESWGRLQALFAEVRGREPEERATLLDHACADDPALRAEVDRLLAAHDQAEREFTPPNLAAAIGRTEASAGAHRIGSRIGPFRLERLIAEGGMGSVYEARQDNPERTVALKVIRSGLATPRALRRFEHEANILARLQHAGIAQIFEAGTFLSDRGEQPYFAMELIRGKPLDRYAEAHGADTRRRVELLARVCDAVHHAHQKGVIHRDLKPANILVDASDQPKILDFGVARATESDVQAASVRTLTGELLGTVLYMSPEQLAGDPDDLDLRCDIYALGVVGFQLLSGRLPLDVRRKSLVEAARVIRDEPPTTLGSISRALRGDLDTILAKALEKEQDRRFQSAAELAADLRRYLADEPILARPPSAAYQLRKFVRRNKALVAGLVAVFITLALGTGGTTWKALAERDQRERAEQEVAKARAINDVLQSILLAPDPFTGKGPDVTVREAMDLVAARIESELADQPEVEAAVRMTLGGSYRHLGLLAEAEPHIVRALEIHQNLFGPDHDQTTRSLTLLAHLWINQGRLDRAEQAHRQVLASLRRTRGDHDRDTYAVMTNLALVLRNQDKLDEAASLLVDALAGQQRRIGPDHHETLHTRTVLARLRARQGRTDEAMASITDIVAARSRLHGSDHPATVVAIESHAIILRDSGRMAEAEARARQAFEQARRVLGEGHQTTMRIRDELVGILLSLGRLEDADEQARAAMDLAQRRLDPDHPRRLAAASTLADVLLARQRLDEAEPLYLDVWERRRRLLGIDHGSTRAVAAGLADLHDAGNRPDDAARWRARAEDGRGADR